VVGRDPGFVHTEPGFFLKETEFLDRCRACAADPSPETWTGVEVISTK
jgi:hypothetical protein